MELSELFRLNNRLVSFRFVSFRFVSFRLVSLPLSSTDVLHSREISLIQVNNRARRKRRPSSCPAIRPSIKRNGKQ